MDRLQYHLSGGGVAGKLASARSADDGSHMLDNKVVDENLCLNGMNSQKASLIKRDVSGCCEEVNRNLQIYSFQKRDMSPNRLQALQAKLAQIKKENHAQ